MTIRRTKRLNFNQSRSERFTERVFEAVKVLGRALPFEVERRIRNQALAEAKKIFDEKRDKIEIKNYVKKNTRVRRVIQRRLKVLTQQGRLEKKEDGWYYVSEFASSEMRFFSGEQPTRFGQQVLGKILSHHYPTLFGIEDNVKRLVEMFGVHAFFCLLEGTRPVPVARKGSNEYLSKLLRDKLAFAWINRVFDPEFMLDALIAALTNQVSEKELERIWKKNMVRQENGKFHYKNNPEDEFKGPPSTARFHAQRFEYMDSKKCRIEYAKKKTKPLYELDKKFISNISNVLKKLYPDYYSRAMETRELYLGRPKESSLRNRFDTFTSFED